MTFLSRLRLDWPPWFEIASRPPLPSDLGLGEGPRPERGGLVPDGLRPLGTPCALGLARVMGGIGRRRVVVQFIS